jgi:hypothetical protein
MTQTRRLGRSVAYQPRTVPSGRWLIYNSGQLSIDESNSYLGLFLEPYSFMILDGSHYLETITPRRLKSYWDHLIDKPAITIEQLVAEEPTLVNGGLSLNKYRTVMSYLEEQNHD